METTLGIIMISIFFNINGQPTMMTGMEPYAVAIQDLDHCKEQVVPRMETYMSTFGTDQLPGPYIIDCFVEGDGDNSDLMDIIERVKALAPAGEPT